MSGLRVAERGKRWHAWLDRLTQRLVRWHVCVSEGVRQFAVEAGLPADRLLVIPNGVDTERFANAAPADLTPLGVPRGAWTVVTVGRLSEQKAQADLVRAMAPLMEDDRSIHLLIVGEGPRRESLVQLAVDLGVSGQVHLPGRQANIPGILKAAQAFALPSRWEGMPNVLLEALAAGLPCVATDVEGVRELIGAGPHGKIVAPGDVAALMQAVSEFRHDSACEVGGSLQHYITKHFRWENVALEYADLYARTIAEGPKLGV